MLAGMKVLIISCSLNKTSRSATLCAAACEDLAELGHDVSMIDLRELPLPFCDAGSCYSDPNAVEIKKQIAAADAVLLGVPVYNYGVNAAAKNVVELTGRDAWTGKVVGFLCAAGGQGSFMSVMPMANSLMLDFRCVIVPRFVYATKAAFQDGKIVSDEIRKRVKGLCLMTGALAKGVDHSGYVEIVGG